MKQVNIHQAKTHLSRLIEQVRAGEEIVIAKGGEPVARLVPFPRRQPRRLGTMRGRIWVAPDFNAPLSEDLMAAFEGRRRR